MNKYPLWKNLLLLFVFIIAVFYAVPNIFPDDPSIQLSSQMVGAALNDSDLRAIKNVLHAEHLPYKDSEVKNKHILVRFTNTDTQLKADEALKKAFPKKYIIAESLESATPRWLQAIGAHPMKLGLDLRGGVHMLLQVDIDSVIKRREKGDIRNISEELRTEKIRYAGIIPVHSGGIDVRFRKEKDLSSAKDLLQRHFPDYAWKDITKNNNYQLAGQLLPSAIQKIGQYAIDQTQTTLSHRVNELGVTEAVVQQQGRDRISVDLPGVQDATRAKDILGQTATIEFHMVDTEHTAGDAVGGFVPAGDLLYESHGSPVLLKSRVLLRGSSITDARSTFDEAGKPSVSIRLGGGGESLFERVTAENVGKPMATLYVETKPIKRMVNGKEKITYKTETRIINIATINSALGESFQVTGLSSPQESQNLALLLRAGSLPTGLASLQERMIGPSMGQQNIHRGMLSISIGFLLVVFFMALYYHFFGVVADIGLFVNLVFLTAILSLLGATLTFPGIAGLVLTVGMAVDYNVLIYERIREELRGGMTPQAAIHTGYDKAFVTIVDANITTLIVALILFALGSGAVKSFAIVLTIGLFTSLVSSVSYTRAVVNLTYGGRKIKRLSIGIKSKSK